MKKIYCKGCKKELKGGFYNTPQGTFCSECWKSKSQKTRDKAFEETIRRLAFLGASFQDNN